MRFLGLVVAAISLLALAGCGGETGTAAPDAAGDAALDQAWPEAGGNDAARADGPEATDDSTAADGRGDEGGPGELAETGGTDGPWNPEPGEAGAACKTGADCNAGYCIHTDEGQKCTQTCVDECPFGWMCALHTASQPDQVYICVPPHMGICRPCQANSDCWTDGIDAGQECVSYGAAGFFCGTPCNTPKDCPGG
jgi:hypothetical protein